jgi:hypothetical protein
MFGLELEYIMSIKAEVSALEKVINSLKEIRKNLNLENDDWLDFRIGRLELKLAYAKESTSKTLSKLPDIEI